jgi:hypothetical protein
MARPSAFVLRTSAGHLAVAPRFCGREGGWSGRRGSNPRPTAWKAVTLPLSYSRLRARARSPDSRFGGTGPPSSVLNPARSRLASPFPSGLPSRSPRRERRMVAREGLEPSKPLGRQIYSLLRLTASLPRQLPVFWNRVRRHFPCGPMRPYGLELAKGLEPPTC